MYEVQTARTPTSYSYAFREDKPLFRPLKDYNSTLSVSPDGEGTNVDWRASWDLIEGSGMDKDASIAFISTIFTSGLNNLVANQ